MYWTCKKMSLSSIVTKRVRVYANLSIIVNKLSQSKKTSPLRYRGADSSHKKKSASKSKSGSKPRSKPTSNDKSAKKHKFKRNSQSPISPYRSTSVHLYNLNNKDLLDIVTSPNSFKSPKQQRSGSKQPVPSNKLLPRLNFSGLIDDPIYDRPTQDNAIDSNRAIAFAYYTRRLMLVGWRSLFNYRLEKIEKKFFERICYQKVIKNRKRRVI
jgi:hypothetical protein